MRRRPVAEEPIANSSTEHYAPPKRSLKLGRGVDHDAAGNLESHPLAIPPGEEIGLEK